MKLTFLYCEGPHDVAFISKLIDQLHKTNNHIDLVSGLPKPIQNIIKTAVSNIDIDSLRIDKPLRAFFPNKVYSLIDEHYVCLFSMGGKEQLQAALKNIENSKLLIGREKLTGIKTIRHLFVLDADYKLHGDGSINNRGGVENTLNILSDNIKTVIEDFTPFSENPSWVDTDYGHIGSYIFTDSGNEEGTVEDLVALFIKPKALDQHCNTFCKAVIDFDTDRKANRKDKTKLQKINFTAMTQAFHPGCSLAVGLSNDKIIDTAKLSAHQLINDFGDFLTN